MSLTHQLFLHSIRELGDIAQDKFDTHRLPLIACLLDHVWRAVPAYRERLAPWVEDESFDLARWSDLALLPRDQVIALGAALRAGAFPPHAADVEDVRDKASPVGWRSKLTGIAAACEQEWMFERNDVDLGASLAILHPDHVATSREGSGWSITFTENRWVAGDIDAEPSAQRDWLVESGARLLRTDAAIAERLSAAGGVLPIDVLIVADPGLTTARRKAIETAAGIAVMHVIEAPGLGVLAASDPLGGYLVPAASMVVEVVNSEGRPADDGELVVTPIYEYAVPRLRYATGIAARAAPHPQTLLGVRRLAAAGGLSL
jgi:hypothetical protein